MYIALTLLWGKNGLSSSVSAACWRLFAWYGLKVEGCGVNAIAQARLISRAVLKDMAQVAATSGTEHLGALHAQTRVFVELDVALANNVPEARPARSRMKFGVRREQIIFAGGANVGAIVFVVDEFAGKRPFSARLAQDIELLIGELLAPLLVCFGNISHASSLLANGISGNNRPACGLEAPRSI